MKRLPYKAFYFPIRTRDRGNYKADPMETNSRVYSRQRKMKFQYWDDGYNPVGLLRGRRGRND